MSTVSPAGSADWPPPCHELPEWRALQAHHARIGPGLDVRQALAQDPHRFEQLGVDAPEVFVDFSRHWWDALTRDLMLDLARARGLHPARESLFSGGVVNATEGRAALHTALRAPAGVGPFSQAVQAELDRMLAFAQSIRDQVGAPFTDVVNIGIGGSDLGLQLGVSALEPFGLPGLRVHGVSNVDAHDITSVLKHCRPHSTLFVVSSKSFSTQETLVNAHLARAWFLAEGGEDIDAHFVATTTHIEAAQAFGISRTFGFWDWVGGRYSIWSSIGLPLALAIGPQAFRELLAGAHAMDQHFLQAPDAQNAPLLLGLLDVWYRNFYGLRGRCVSPYHHGLRRLPAYLQQLDMESNGKGVDVQGRPMAVHTGAAVWGEPGSNAQHAFFQWIHQGTEVVPVEFIVARKAQHPHELSQRLLLCNALAQAQALTQGQSIREALQERAPTASPELDPQILAQHRGFPGNRPSGMLTLDALTPRSLGALIALYEHRVWVAAQIWGINPFDQWGVELGKTLCQRLLPSWGQAGAAGQDPTTAAWMRRWSRP